MSDSWKIENRAHRHFWNVIKQWSSTSTFQNRFFWRFSNCNLVRNVAGNQKDILIADAFELIIFWVQWWLKSKNSGANQCKHLWIFLFSYCDDAFTKIILKWVQKVFKVKVSLIYLTFLLFIFFTTKFVPQTYNSSILKLPRWTE